MDKQKLYDMLEFANAAASIITTRKGALKVMPEEADVRNFIQESFLYTLNRSRD
jgi:fructokinase